MAQSMNNGNGFPMVAKKQLPNDPCRCNSGKKAKKCCGTETTYFYTELNETQKKEMQAKLLKEAEEARKNEPAEV